MRLIKKLLRAIYSLLNKLVPKNKKLIFIVDARLYRQNTWTLFRYLADNGYGEYYKIVLYTAEREQAKALDVGKGAKIVTSFFGGAWNRLRAKYVFTEYGRDKFSAARCDRQEHFEIWHGMPLKRIGYASGENHINGYEKEFSHLLVTGSFFVPVMKECFRCRDEQIYLGGYPRSDSLFAAKPTSFRLNKGFNVVWMPTFRRSSGRNLIDSDSEFPLLTPENMPKLNRTLSENDIKLIIKIHPMQDGIDWLKRDYSNIEVITNADIFAEGLELYELLGQSDALVTDYSSVYIDYLLTDKPIIFASDDFGSYKDKRGFTVDDPFAIMPGVVVDSTDALASEILRLKRGEDDYAERREEFNALFNAPSPSGSYCRDILDFVGIKPKKE